jgi:4-carboxymuconolactone decarboxylase
MASLQERYEAAQPVLARLGRVDAAGVPLPSTVADEIAPDLARLIREACFGSLWTRPALSVEQRSLATISIITVLRRDDNLKGHIHSGLDVGLTPEQIVEVMIQLIFYAGAPIANTALRIAYDVFKERAIQVHPIRAFDPTEDPDALYQRGLATRRLVVGDDLGAEFDRDDETDAAWERYMLEYLWGSVWTRPGLDLQSRCICVLTAQTIIGTDRTIANFIRAALRVGLSETQVKELFFHLTFYTGIPPARRAMALAKQIFGSGRA